MLYKLHNFNSEQVEETLQLKSWWAALAILPFVRKLVLYLCNYTEISPNTITVISFVLRIISAYLFLVGKYLFLVSGAIIFELAYLLDCVDGPIARLKKKTSKFGRYFDHMSDLCCGILVLSALAYGQKMLFSPLIVGIIYVYISEYYITLLANLVLEKKSGQSARIEEFKKNKIVGIMLECREFFFKKKFKSFFSLPDFEAITLFIFPIMGNPILGLKIGFCVIIVITLYKIWSSFLTIQIEGRDFP